MISWTMLFLILSMLLNVMLWIEYLALKIKTKALEGPTCFFCTDLRGDSCVADEMGRRFCCEGCKTDYRELICTDP